MLLCDGPGDNKAVPPIFVIPLALAVHSDARSEDGRERAEWGDGTEASKFIVRRDIFCPMPKHGRCDWQGEMAGMGGWRVSRSSPDGIAHRRDGRTVGYAGH